MKLVLRIVAVIALGASLTACATVTRGSKEDFKVESTPPGAKVKTSAGTGCEATPCTFKMPRKDGFDVTLTKEGYKTATARITNRMSGAGTAGLAGNVILGGVIGVVVDANTGAMMDLTPNPLLVILEPEGGAEAAAAPAAPAEAGAQ